VSRWLKKQMERMKLCFVRGRYDKEEWRRREMGKVKGMKE